jgi:hypothetical protein
MESLAHGGGEVGIPGRVGERVSELDQGRL